MENDYKNLSERLRYALKIKGLSQTDLAKKINVKPQVIQYLCASSSEKSKFTFDIAEALGIDVTWLATGKGEIPVFTMNPSEKAIPLLTFQQVREWKVYKKNFDKKAVASWIAINDGISLNSFALRLNDRSMAPRFDLDTIVIIDNTIDVYTTPLHSRFVLVYIAEEDFVIFRQLNIENDVKTLLPINNTLYKKTLLKEKDIILGICKEARWVN